MTFLDLTCPFLALLDLALPYLTLLDLGSLGLILVDLGDFGYMAKNLENDTNIQTYKHRIPRIPRDPIGSNNIGLIMISTCDHRPGSTGSVTCDTRGGANIFSKYCSWFVKLFVGQPRLHKVKLSNIQHSCPQTNEPIYTLKRITNKQTFQVHVFYHKLKVEQYTSDPCHETSANLACSLW